jgi:hypothetical protein
MIGDRPNRDPVQSAGYRSWINVGNMGLERTSAASGGVEVAKGLLDGGSALGRTRIGPGRGMPVVSWPERKAVQFLDVGDPTGPRTEAVVRKDVGTDLAIGGATLDAARW